MTNNHPLDLHARAIVGIIYPEAASVLPDPLAALPAGRQRKLRDAAAAVLRVELTRKLSEEDVGNACDAVGFSIERRKIERAVKAVMAARLRELGLTEEKTE